MLGDSVPTAPETNELGDPILDCTRPANFIFWLLSGSVVVLVAQFVYVSANGGNWAYLIRVGENASLRPRITSELGDVRPTDELGHDGQMCYAIARDPWDRQGTSELIRHVDPQYRYRRILYPLLSGGAGLFSPRQTLWGLIVFLLAGAGVSAVATADIAFQNRLSGAVALAGMLNPGILLAAVALTPDALACGLGMAALAFWGRGRRGLCITCLTLAILTKETHLLFGIGLALVAWKRGERWAAVKVVAIPLAFFAAWSAWCWLHVVHGSSPMHNFTFPGAGIWAAVRQWLDADLTALELLANFAVAGFGLAMIIAACWTSFRSKSHDVTACTLLWAFIAITTSVSVWGEPTNLIRVVAPLWPLVCINTAEALKR